MSQKGKVAEAIKVIGEPERCISLGSVRSTRIRDDQTIDFIGTNGKAWRNTLARRCNGLMSSPAFAYRNRSSRVCSLDAFYPVDLAGVRRFGEFCQLGEFVPIEFVNDEDEKPEGND